MGLFSDDRSDEQKLKDKIDALTKDVNDDGFFETEANRKADREELAALREQYAQMIGAGGGGTTVINNNMAAAPSGGGGGTDTVIVPEPMTNQSHPRNRRRR